MRLSRVLGVVVLAGGLVAALIVLSPAAGAGFSWELQTGPARHGSVLAWVGLAAIASGLILIAAGMIKASRSKT